MLPKIPFGRTGHMSTRLIFGAAALASMRQDKADATLEVAMQAGINHIDVAASYGDAEERLKPFLADHRQEVFLATKTGERSGAAARASIERSLTRMGVERLDLLQFHNLAQDGDWQTVFAKGGAMEAARRAQEEGLVQHLGVTGHGTRIAEMHLKSLAEHDFASVLLPYNYLAMQEAIYAEEFEQLYALCQERQVAMQTIKSVARRPWREDDPSPRFTWYEPIREDEPLTRAVHFVLRREGLFLNTASDAGLLPKIIAAAESFTPEAAQGLEPQLAADQSALAAEPLFVRGISDNP